MVDFKQMTSKQSSKNLKLGEADLEKRQKQYREWQAEMWQTLRFNLKMKEIEKRPKYIKLYESAK